VNRRRRIGWSSELEIRTLELVTNSGRLANIALQLTSGGLAVARFRARHHSSYAARS
jgi:hypothetical protein